MKIQDSGEVSATIMSPSYTVRYTAPTPVAATSPTAVSPSAVPASVPTAPSTVPTPSTAPVPVVATPPTAESPSAVAATLPKPPSTAPTPGAAAMRTTRLAVGCASNGPTVLAASRSPPAACATCPGKSNVGARAREGRTGGRRTRSKTQLAPNQREQQGASTSAPFPPQKVA